MGQVEFQAGWRVNLCKLSYREERKMILFSDSSWFICQNDLSFLPLNAENNQNWLLRHWNDSNSNADFVVQESGLNTIKSYNNKDLLKKWKRKLLDISFTTLNGFFHSVFEWFLCLGVLSSIRLFLDEPNNRVMSYRGKKGTLKVY